VCVYMCMCVCVSEHPLKLTHSFITSNIKNI